MTATHILQAFFVFFALFFRIDCKRNTEADATAYHKTTQKKCPPLRIFLFFLFFFLRLYNLLFNKGFYFLLFFVNLSERVFISNFNYAFYVTCFFTVNAKICRCGFAFANGNLPCKTTAAGVKTFNIILNLAVIKRGFACVHKVNIKGNCILLNNLYRQFCSVIIQLCRLANLNS